MKGLRLTVAIAATALIASACSESLPTEAASDATPSYARNPKADESGNKLQCFQGFGRGYNGTCELVTDGAYINTIDGDDNPNNNYAGVYIPSNLGGRLLSDINKLSFDYSGSGAAGGSPRITLPIDENGDGALEAYAYIDTQGCNNGGANVGTLDAINDATCTISYGANYENWTAFVTANPAYRVSTDDIAFIVVDQPGTFTITNVQLGRGTAKARG